MKKFNEGIAVYAILASTIFALSIAFFIYTAIRNIEQLGSVSRILFIIVMLVTVITILIILFTHESDSLESSTLKDAPVFSVPATVNEPLSKSITQNAETPVTKDSSSSPTTTEPTQNPIAATANISTTSTAQDVNTKNEDPAPLLSAPTNTFNTDVKQNNIEPTSNSTESDTFNSESDSTSDISHKNDFEIVRDEALSTNAELSVLQETYSINTGVVKGGLLCDRLNSELVRASGNGEELSLIKVESPMIDTKSDNFKEVADSIVKTTRVRDYVFDNDDGSFFIIAPNVDITAATALGKEILKGAQSTLGALSKVFLGITSRAGRMIDAVRLITECTQAVKKAATEDTSKIVSFHVDLDKYRDEVLKA